MSTLYKHRIYCTTEGGWVYLWKDNDTLLSTCPNNPAHSVQAGSASIIEERSSGIVEVNKEPGFQTGGYVKVDTITINAPALSSGSVTKSWPIDIAIYTIRAAVTSDCIGCTVKAEAAPLTTVGTLTANAPIGTTVLSVSPSAAANAAKGLIITLQQGATVQELGRAIAIDKILNTITVETATTSNFLAAGPTLVKITSRAAENLLLVLTGYLIMGEDRSKAVVFPAGRTLVLTVTNPNLVAANLTVYVSYNY